MLVPVLAPLLLQLPFALAGSDSSVKGVHPHKAAIYRPSPAGTWRCVDGSKEIKWKAVNDDYCDCPDGSDEPGTSACPNGAFYCKNTGHIGASIRSSHVGDGLCEPECCDGSDEAPGVCPDTCEAIGKKHREEQASLNKIRREGAKTRASYIAFAKTEKQRIKESIYKLKRELEAKRGEEKVAHERLQQLESLDAEAVEVKKQSPLYSALEEHKAAINTLHYRNKDLKNKIESLERLLNDLESGFNPNYVDMAVISTVKAWKAMKGVHDEAEGAEEPEKVDEPVDTAETKEEVKHWSDSDFYKFDGQNPLSLILDHEKHIANQVSQKTSSLLFRVEEYLPEAFLPQYEAAKEYLLDLLSTVGIVPKRADITAELEQARADHNAASNALRSTQTNLEEEEDALSKLYAVDGFGKEGEWKKLQGTCLNLNSGGYTYSVCLFDSAVQRSNRDGASNHLGRFSSWHPSATPGSALYYGQQMYTGGARCWNGPERSVRLELSCGTENEILSVSEPEKCEYLFVGTSPALCLPVEGDEKHDEL